MKFAFRFFVVAAAAVATTLALALGAADAGAVAVAAAVGDGNCPPSSVAIPADFPSCHRPPVSSRKFVSAVIEEVIANTSARITDDALRAIFENAYPNTLDTTVEYFRAGNDGTGSGPDAFVITGDIDAQWLRDSTNQLLPYMPYVSLDANLSALVCGLVRRQARNILHDSYANSFNFNASGAGHQSDIRTPPMTPEVFEGKYELDSLLAAIKLAYHYFAAAPTAAVACLLGDFPDAKAPSAYWLEAAVRILDTIIAQQAPTSNDQPYLFERDTTVATDTTVMYGTGPVARRTGMSRSMFRPSDDATTLPFLVPSNAMAVVELGHLTTIVAGLLPQPIVQANATLVALAKQVLSVAPALAKEIDAGIQAYAIVPVPQWVLAAMPAATFVRDAATGQALMYAYEVDGYGGQVLMDDANIPSLLSLPLLGYTTADDAVYANTRAFLLSAHNPFFFNGTAGQGIGGPHVGLNHVWPMSLIARALTSTDGAEIQTCLQTLATTTAGTGYMHESFFKDDASQFTRPWFAWANGLFGQLMLSVVGGQKSQSQPQSQASTSLVPLFTA